MTWPTKTDFLDGDVLTAAQVNNIGTNLNIFNPTSANSGDVWVADGAGSGSFTTVGGGLTLLATGSMAGVNTLTISSIPQDYEHLQLVISEVYSSGSNQVCIIKPNNVGTNRAVGYYSYSDASTTFTGVATQTANPGNIAELIYTTSVSTHRSRWVYTIWNYTETTNGRKQVTSISNATKTGQTYVSAIGQAVAALDISAAITSIVIDTLGGSNWAAGTYELWGVS